MTMRISSGSACLGSLVPPETIGFAAETQGFTTASPVIMASNCEAGNGRPMR